jgi:hypothetical protein
MKGGGMNNTPLWLIVLGLSVFLGFWGAVIYVAVHFIAKFW